ncbi:hypothetical protein [Bailinhaonella thermotolerans]|uniref:DUF2746 domain-containing protein n=1 Tax=Bailinhaonella thermotolerans TaxID=1070861 RepID=A0A3A4AJS8_9ACTN|nr:hypothetical protein [Bailinhaonella thermotolerans]RJL21121.1 hypothetical protein D5H75_38590 [Bailinhaonella thermotolerans]
MTGPELLQLFAAAATVAGGLALLVLLGRMVVWAWRFLRRVGHFLDDWQGEQPRPGVPARPGIPERLASVEARMAGVEARMAALEVELSHDGGATLRDAVGRVEDGVARVEDGLRAHIDQHREEP